MYFNLLLLFLETSLIFKTRLYDSKNVRNLCIKAFTYFKWQILLLGHLSLKKSVVRIRDILINFKAECPFKMTTGKMICNTHNLIEIPEIIKYKTFHIPVWKMV